VNTPTDQEIQIYLSKVRAKYGVDLPEAFARDFLAFTFEMDERYRALQAELEDLRAAQLVNPTRTRRGKSEARS
jgi:hypothetical protein